MRYGGELRDGYGAWSVGAPGGLPLRLLVGDEPRDRVMYVAYRCLNVKKSVAFYEANGFRKKPYPRARPVQRVESVFDPDPPKGAAAARRRGVFSSSRRRSPIARPRRRRDLPPRRTRAASTLRRLETASPAGAVYLEACAERFGILLVPFRQKRAPLPGTPAVGALRVASADAAGSVVDPDGNLLERTDGGVFW